MLYISEKFLNDYLNNDLIKKNWRLLPCKIRLESPIDAPTWVHVDVMTEGQQDAVYVFRA